MSTSSEQSHVYNIIEEHQIYLLTSAFNYLKSNLSTETKRNFICKLNLGILALFFRNFSSQRLLSQASL